MPETQRAAKFFTVPAGTRPAQCNGSTCRATIYWIQNPATGRMLPVDVDVEGGQEPSAHVRDPKQQSLFGDTIEHYNGRGVSHFTTCPDVGEFSRGRR